MTKLTIAVHSGKFHADDAFGVAILRNFIGIDAVAVTRTRDQQVIDAADYVIDVGGVYDPANRQFDHHQFKPGDDEYGKAAVSLVWEEYGGKVVSTLFPALPMTQLEWVVNRISDTLVKSIAEVDTGIASSTGYDVNTLVSAMNPGWEAGFVSGDDEFNSAVEWADTVLRRAIGNAVSQANAWGIVQQADDIMYGGKRALVLGRCCPWITHVIGDDDMSAVQYVVYQSGENDWRIQVVPVSPDDRTARKDLPDSWAGLKGGELQKACGCPDATFCHIAKFIAGASSKSGILDMAKQALLA